MRQVVPQERSGPTRDISPTKGLRKNGLRLFALHAGVVQSRAPREEQRSHTFHSRRHHWRRAIKRRDNRTPHHRNVLTEGAQHTKGVATSNDGGRQGARSGRKGRHEMYLKNSIRVHHGTVGLQMCCQGEALGGSDREKRSWPAERSRRRHRQAGIRARKAPTEANQSWVGAANPALSGQKRTLPGKTKVSSSKETALQSGKIAGGKEIENRRREGRDAGASKVPDTETAGRGKCLILAVATKGMGRKRRHETAGQGKEKSGDRKVTGKEGTEYRNSRQSAGLTGLGRRRKGPGTKRSERRNLETPPPGFGSRESYLENGRRKKKGTHEGRAPVHGREEGLRPSGDHEITCGKWTSGGTWVHCITGGEGGERYGKDRV